ncbi:MAG: hypothetical protein AAGH48_05745 [Pseudomonadota bacterium]
MPDDGIEPFLLLGSDESLETIAKYVMDAEAACKARQTIRRLTPAERTILHNGAELAT